MSLANLQHLSPNDQAKPAGEYESLWFYRQHLDAWPFPYGDEARAILRQLDAGPFLMRVNDRRFTTVRAMVAKRVVRISAGPWDRVRIRRVRRAR